ncbi:hypothetical protein PVAND_004476 [Polypedilum vanderplanki]|uniref:Uncharacterized protein n=1 Tax=Polypedilum vanderplanki TaxID=319348 RepID=A0A9J6BXP1_POLVA|nr:hypothetical protein PVAND_004476 [Polypedilum vanderplanki]
MRLRVDRQHKAVESWKIVNLNKNLVSETSKENFLITTWKTFTKHSSMHAVHYLTAESMKVFEKLFWLFVIFLASLAMAYCCILLSNRFSSSLTSTVFESTNFKVIEIPFPSITICNANRINYNKTDEAIEKFIPNFSNKDQKLFVRFLEILQNMDYGSFDEFTHIADDYKGQFDHLNIFEIYKFMIHECKDFFVDCKWRNKKVDCCKFFSLQITEYGLCYSFNSYTNEPTELVSHTKNFPWRSASSGKNSALDVIVNTQPSTRIEYESSQIGIQAIVQHPFEHPNNGQFIAVKSVASLIIKPTVFSTSDDVRNLDPADRQCYYNQEATQLNLTHLIGMPYNRANCMSACRQQHLKKFCNCSVSFLFPSGEIPDCNISSLLCLSKFNEILNAEKPLTKNPYFDENEEGIECFCLPECSRIEYSIVTSPIYDEKLLNDDYVQLDVHYESSMVMKYRTDVCYSWLDLLVGFGGILGLFFGCSILSGVEFIYFSTIALIIQYKRSKGKLVKKIRANFPFTN